MFSIIPYEKEKIILLQQLAKQNQFNQIQQIFNQTGEQRYSSTHKPISILLSKYKKDIQQNTFDLRTQFCMLFTRFYQMCQNGSYQGAFQFYEDLVKMNIVNNNGYIALYNLAYIAEKLQKFEESQFYYVKSLKDRPQFTEGTVGYCFLLIKMQRKLQALQLLENFLKYYPEDPNRNIDLLYLSLANANHYGKIIRRYKNKKIHYEIQYNLSLYLMRISKFLQAQSILEKMCQDQNISDLIKKFSHIQLAKIMELKNCYERAISLYQLYENESVIIQKKICQLKYNYQISINKQKNKIKQEINTNQRQFMATPSYLYHDQSIQKQITMNNSNPKKKLKFLINKEKELRNFFQGLTMKSNYRKNKCIEMKQNIRESLEGFEKQFEQKSKQIKQKIRLEQIQQVTNKYISQNFNSALQKTKGQQAKKIIKTPINQKVEKLNQTQKNMPAKKSKDFRIKTINDEQILEKRDSSIKRKHSKLKEDYNKIRPETEPQIFQIDSKTFQNQNPCQYQNSISQKQQKQINQVFSTDNQNIANKYKQVTQLSITPNNDMKIMEQDNSEIISTQLTTKKQNDLLDTKLHKQIKKNTIINPNKDCQILDNHEQGVLNIIPTQKQDNFLDVQSYQNSQNKNNKIYLDLNNHLDDTEQKIQIQKIHQKLKIQKKLPITLNKTKQFRKDKRISSSNFHTYRNNIKQSQKIAKPGKNLMKKNTKIQKKVIQQKKQSTYDNMMQTFRQFANSSNFSEAERVLEDLMKTNPDKFKQIQIELLQVYEKNRDYEKVIQIYKKKYKQASKDSQKSEILLRLGDAYLNNNQSINAEKCYQKAIRLNNSQGFFKIGQLKLSQNKIVQAVQNLEKALCNNRDRLDIKLKLAYGYSLLDHQLNKALIITNQILALQPTNIAAILLSANIHQKNGDISTALKISQGIDQNQPNTSIKHYIGLLYLQKNDVQKAYYYFREALKLNPNYVASLIQAATILSSHDPQNAVIMLKKAIKLQPQNVTALLRLAKICEVLKKFDNAMQCYQKAIEHERNYENYANLGQCLFKCNKFQNAIQSFKAAITYKSQWQMWDKIAQCYFNLKQYGKASTYYQKSIDLNNQNPRSYKQLAMCQIYLENFDIAIKYLNFSLEFQINSECYILIANCYYLLDQFNQAIQNYQKALQLKGFDLTLLYNIAICFDQKEQFLNSKPIYETILSKQPNNIKCLYNLANGLLILGKTPQGLALFEKAIALQPNKMARRYELINIYQSTENIVKAEPHLLYCLKEDDENPDIIQKLIKVYKKKKDIKKVNKYQKALLNTKSRGLRVKTQQ